ncbi:MAG TPA: sugar phosphate isomerase/epimerase family protein [Methanocellaceae archaeon]|jgi:sugar phosphate isomerase/epimerase
MHDDLKLGFSTLSVFMKPPESWEGIARGDEFNALEILCEGPMWPRAGLWKSTIEGLGGNGMEVYMHSPTIDLNPASVNGGIREETLRQLKETIDMASGIKARFVTTHPGVIHRPDPFILDMCREFAMVVLGEASDYAKENGVILSIENMPFRKTYLCGTSEELDMFRERCGSNVTIDVGHAILSPDPMSFLRLKNISYLHVNDNKGDKDSHLCPGDGILDLNMLKCCDRMIIELNRYDNVLRARDIILDTLQAR